MSVARYMQLCLTHPTEGYYTRPSNVVFGRRGDFVTSPEISQVFGELVGVWLLSQWKNASEKTFRLVELGPGRGTLMKDILRVVSHFPASRSALQSVHLVESSHPMRALQRDAVGEAVRAAGWKVAWHDSVEDVPLEGEFTMVVAHEFFDALPVHVLEKTDKGWQEVLISEGSSQTRLQWVLSPTPTASSTLLGLSSGRFAKQPVGARIEVCPSAFKIARRVGELVGAKGGGAGLIVDYGGEKVFGNSFRAFKDHSIVDVFHRPGECDLTANVDFAYLKEALHGLVSTHGPLSQTAFLTRMGLDLRVERLKRGASSAERRSAIESGAKRLVDRVGMGREYVALGLTSLENEIWPFY